MSVSSAVSGVFLPLTYKDPLNRPKYQRLVAALTEGIQNGVWRPGDKLPAEEEIAELTPYSLGTVQRALRDMAEQGLVLRHHGIGSFVAEAPRQIQNPWHCRFLDDDGVSILPVHSKATDRFLVKDRGVWSSYLGDQADIMRLDRVILVNGDEFRVSSRFYADKNIMKPLWESDLEQLNGLNLKQIIVDQFKLPITSVEHLVKVQKFDEATCKAIGVTFPCTGLFLQAVARGGRDKCAYYQEFYVAPTARPLQLIDEAVSA